VNLADLINRFRVDCRRLHTFNMDEFLDRNGRTVPETHPMSFKGEMMRGLYGRLPAALRVGEPCMIRMGWENRGVAPAYHAYVLRIRLEGFDTRDFDLDSHNRGWMPAPSIRSTSRTTPSRFPQT
jgi:6-phosphogluconolactonase/glucosamine-6-phosphate isomerase/deaminase